MRGARIALTFMSWVALVRCTSFDARPSATSPDAASPDAATDAGAAAETGASDGGCGHLFCEDFDDDAGLTRWVPTTGGAGEGEVPTIGIDPSASTSPPSSFFAFASSFGYSATGQIEKDFDVGSNGLGNGLRCSLDVQVAEQPVDGLSTFIAIAVRGTGPNYTINLNLDNVGRTALQENSLPSAEGPRLGGEWKHLTLELQTAAAKFSVIAGDRYDLALQLLPANIKSYALKIGVVFGNPYGTPDVKMRVRFDSVRCDAL